MRHPLTLFPLVWTLSTALVVEETRARLSQAFLSPSGKLTYSPELLLPEPTDPTAILLQANAIQTLSMSIRTAKANAAFVRSSLTALQTFCAEQQSALGNFPGPVPVVYCGTAPDTDWSAVAETGADGVLIDVGGEIGSMEDIDASWTSLGRAALECGLQPIPQVTIGHEAAQTWSEANVEALVSKLTDDMGSEPVCVLLTVNPVDEEQQEPVALPPVPKSLGKRVPILGSVRVMAGENRISTESARFKQAGYTGALLRSECVPGFRVQLNLEIVSQFWSHCIEDLKSVRSKSFQFRSKNNMEKSALTNWANYQKGVIESGALGDPEDSYSIVDSTAGEYKGFA